jgi:hypothetical protein
LVVVADHTEIAALARQKEKDALLNGVGVLVALDRLELVFLDVGHASVRRSKL